MSRPSCLRKPTSFITQNGEFSALTADQAMTNFSAWALAGRSDSAVAIMTRHERILLWAVAMETKWARKNLMSFGISPLFSGVTITLSTRVEVAYDYETILLQRAFA